MILVDEHEPDNILKLIKQSAPAMFHPLNRVHRSDYFFSNYEGKTFQFSRKQAAELIGDIDEAERQLADYYPNADYNFQVVEGWISPLPIHGIDISDHSYRNKPASARMLGQKLFCYAIQPNGHIERGHSFSAVQESMLYAWIHRLARAGIPTYYTTNWVGTAKMLAAIYRNEQKPPEEHSTLQRVIRPKLILKEPEPLMKALMYLSEAYHIGIGEKKARAICDKYVNLVDIAMADLSEIAGCEGVGSATAKKLLVALGRTI